RVLLICPPYQTTALSSLATAQLASLVREAGVDCHEAYLHFPLAKLLGSEAYKVIANGMRGLLGEMLFSEALHHVHANPHEAELAGLLGSPARRAELRSVLEQSCLDSVRQRQPTLVGITTSCNQTLRSEERRG